jgi:hypothetical protein
MVNRRIIVGDLVILNKYWYEEASDSGENDYHKIIWKVLDSVYPEDPLNYFYILSILHSPKKISIILPEYCLSRLNNAKNEEFLRILYSF